MGATQSKATPFALDTPRGRVRGIQQSDLNGTAVLTRFLGIPYAQPPVGPLRWRRPQPLSQSWTFDSGDYTSFAPVCPQPEFNSKAARLECPDACPDIENAQSEDCLYLNVWVPAGPAPPNGWPVQFQIHGGWLQIGDAMQSNDHDPFDLLAHSTKRIIVAATYRLNLFGFLAGAEVSEAQGEVAGNYGLWDQRAALEWTHANIHLFGGNKDLITVGGLSAGAHSSFLQLYYDTYLPKEKQIIQQVYLWSNAMAIQPNAANSEVLTEQFRELCNVTGVQGDSAKARLDGLRDVPSEKLVQAISKLKMHTFRTSTDDDFLAKNFLDTLHNGSFADKLAANGTRIVVGEVRDEALLYKLVNAPTTSESLRLQLRNYYPQHVVEELLTLKDVYDLPEVDDGSEETKERYKDVFARIVADMQVHAAIRGLTRCVLAPEDEGKPTAQITRYRISWRARGLDRFVKPEVGVCHAGDTPIWWASGYRAGYTADDRKASEKFLLPFGDFLHGKPFAQNQTKASTIARYLDEHGNTHENVDDELWDKCMRVWQAVAKVQKVGN